MQAWQAEAARGRAPVYAPHGVAATGHALATAAALDVLGAGGNAVDAALAASAVLCVVMPHQTGLGGDGFALVVDPDGRVTAVSSGGRAGSGADRARYPRGASRRGLRAACVPGLVDAWEALRASGASLSRPRLLARAVGLAEAGFPVSRDLAEHLARHADLLAADGEAARLFLPGGAPPGAGERLRQADLGASLRAVAEAGRAGFYAGPVGEALAAAFRREADGLITADDLRGHRAGVGAPLWTEYRGWRIALPPPPTQGHVLAQCLQIAAAVEAPPGDRPDAAWVHFLIEAKKRAFADRTALAGDPERVRVDWERLLSPAQGRARAATIEPGRAATVEGSDSVRLDTTQFAVADRDGRVVTMIQSLFHPFGCGVVAPGTGVLLNNRMRGFDPRPGSPNAMAPGKRTLHTLHTYALFRAGALVAAGGTPGGDFQVQTNLQVLTGMMDAGLDAQAAVDAPRWGHLDGLRVTVEARMPREVIDGLRARGHEVVIGPAWDAQLGAAMLVAPVAAGWMAVADARRESAAGGI